MLGVGVLTPGECDAPLTPEPHARVTRKDPPLTTQNPPLLGFSFFLKLSLAHRSIFFGDREAIRSNYRSRPGAASQEEPRAEASRPGSAPAHDSRSRRAASEATAREAAREAARSSQKIIGNL